MTSKASHTATFSPNGGFLSHASVTILGFAILASGSVASAATYFVIDLAPWSIIAAVFVYMSAAFLVLLCGGNAVRGFGLANRITWARLTMTALLAGCAVETAPFNDSAWWTITLFACAALILDGVDGFVARRRNEISAFGARFDMETDAALILVLAMLCWQSGKIGPWVLIIGAMRYVFVAAGWVFPKLTGPLAPSLRRKLVCALQVLGLVSCLAPIVAQDAASIIAAVALTALTLSFAKDIILLCLMETPRVEQ
ncbi:MAG: CDP-alcohol phosphatidyltransferase family protein [Alphaproteobacteria bacterium]|nr:CDP-alcohol phosphatidyltransferase family protein [Alphaproteobacteria bacterium]